MRCWAGCVTMSKRVLCVVVPPRRCWIYIRTMMLIEERVFVPLPDPDEPSLGILHYLTTGNRV